MSQALIGLGSNLGDRRQILDAAIEQISRLDGVELLRTSNWYVTKAIGGPVDQPDYLNRAALVKTSHPADELLSQLRRIEAELGRTREDRWGPRTIDLDLLLVDDFVVDIPQLILPHPRMSFRRFVLEPAAEIAGAMRHPIIGWTISELLGHLRCARPYLAISSDPFAPAIDLARAVATKTRWRFLAPEAHKLELLLTNSPSRASTAAIEFLDAFAGGVSRHFAENQSDSIDSVGAISPIWMEDVLAIGDVLWPGTLDNALQRVGTALVQPKLLIVLHGAESATNPAVPSPRDSDKNEQVQRHRLKELIESVRLKRAKRTGIGPTLWLDTSDLTSAEHEIIASIQAMN